MTATIVPFGKNQAKAQKKSAKAAEDGLDLDPPSTDDLKGFINTLNFLALQTMTRTVSVEVMDDELNVKIQHRDPSDFEETNGVLSATSFEIMAGVTFAPENPNKMIEQLHIAFDRLNLENFEGFEIEGIIIEDEDEDETDGTPTP